MHCVIPIPVKANIDRRCIALLACPDQLHPDSATQGQEQAVPLPAPEVERVAIGKAPYALRIRREGVDCDDIERRSIGRRAIHARQSLGWSYAPRGAGTG